MPRRISTTVSVLLVAIVVLGAALGIVLSQHNNSTPAQATTTIDRVTTATTTLTIVSEVVSTASNETIVTTSDVNGTTFYSSLVSCPVSSGSLTNSSPVILNVGGVNARLTFQPTDARSSVGSCTYAQVHRNTPTTCGPLCGGGIGYSSYALDFTLSLVQFGELQFARNYSLTLSVQSDQFGNLSSIFSGIEPSVYVNSQSVSWSANPPCLQIYENGSTIEPDCMTQDSTSMAFSVPSGGPYQIEINSPGTVVAVP